MKRFLTTLVTFGLLIGLGVLAALARPNGDVPQLAAQAAAPLAESVALAAAPEAAPAAAQNWNAIALPLQVSGIAKADDVANYINNSANPPASGSIPKVAKWDETAQGFIIRNVGSPFGVPNFDVQTGDWLFVLANSNAVTVLSWTGNVPAPGSRSYNIVANGWSDIMMPLDRTETKADALAAAIGNITKVAKWDASAQGFVIRNVNSPFGVPNFDVYIGYPYWIYSTAAKTWP
jgi:hypothetical protein